MTVVIVTTDTNRAYVPMDFFKTNHSLPLRVNSKSPFTLHFAIWPFVGLLFLVVTVWILVYISTIVSRRHQPKTEQRNFVSLYVTQDSTIAGGCEVSNVISPVDV